MSFFRYPGGKRKLREKILSSLTGSFSSGMQYREPFFGGGSIGIEFVKQHPELQSIWINDKDAGIYCLWKSVIEHPEELCHQIKKFKPSTGKFYSYKEELLALDAPPKKDEDILSIGFKKIAIHQISYSGLGTKSGGPLGGEEQKSEYKIDCRWSPDYLSKKIHIIHALLKGKAKCTCQDFEEVISDTTENALIYLDPPYYVEGNKLYQCGFTNEDHRRLMETLKKSKLSWILSYDDDKNGEIRKLYDWADLKPITVKYSITALRVEEDGKITCKSREKPELLISPKCPTGKCKCLEKQP